MKKYKRLSCLFGVLAVLLSHVMCAAVAYNYCSLQWSIGNSAPPSVAFLLCIPYGGGIILCAALAWFFYRKHRKTL